VCDLKWKEEKGEQGHLFQFFQTAPPPNAAPFRDKVALSRHQGEAGWTFRPHPQEEELDVEYRVLISEFMKSALEKAQELSRRSQTMERSNEVPSPEEGEKILKEQRVISIDDLRRRSGT
jgi:hypothetical protein